MKLNSRYTPFHTIRDYVPLYEEGLVDIGNVVSGLIRNFVLFMPMGLLLPSLFKKIRTWGCFVGAVFLMTFLAQLLRVVTMTGVYDVDDILLNVVGACLVFGIVKCRVVSRVLHKVYILE